MGNASSKPSLVRYNAGPSAKKQRQERIESVVPVVSEDVDQTIETWGGLSKQELDIEALQEEQDYLSHERERLISHLESVEEETTSSRSADKRRDKVLRKLRAQLRAVDRKLVRLRDGKFTSFNKFPPEVSALIFRFTLGPPFAVRSPQEALGYLRKLFALRLVCRRWARMIRTDSNLWRISVLRFQPYYVKKTFPLAHKVLSCRGARTLQTYIIVDDKAFSPFESPDSASKLKAYVTSPDVTGDVLTKTMSHSTTLFIRGVLQDFDRNLMESTYSPAFTECLPSLLNLTLTDIKVRTDMGHVLSFLPNLQELSVQNATGVFDTDDTSSYKDDIRLDKLTKLSISSPMRPSLPRLGHLFRFVSLSNLTEVIFHHQTTPSVYEVLSNSGSTERLTVQLGPGWAGPIKEVVEELCRLPLAKIFVNGIVAPHKKSLREKLVSNGLLVEWIGTAFPAKGPRRIEFHNCALAPSRLRDAVNSAQGRASEGRTVPEVVFSKTYLIIAHEDSIVAATVWAHQKVQTAGLGWSFTLGRIVPYTMFTAVAHRVALNDTPETEDSKFLRGPEGQISGYVGMDGVELTEEDEPEELRSGSTAGWFEH